MCVGYLHLMNHLVPNKPVSWCLVFISGQPSCAGFSYFIILAAVHNVLIHKKTVIKTATVLHINYASNPV